MHDFKYDVSISFLVEDISIATALSEKLSESLTVFFFPRNQEELAGTDGLESMRKAFFEDSRLNVVVYRERWGNTPWTGIEAAAIKDSCLNCGFQNVFFFMVEPRDAKPKWLPDTPVRFNYGEFTLEQAVGAIKARVQERGGHFEPLTPLKRAEQLKAEQKYAAAKSCMDSEAGIERMKEEVQSFIRRIESQVAELERHGHQGIECEGASDAVILRHQNVGMIVRWKQRFVNSLRDSALSIEHYSCRLLFQSEISGGAMYVDRPQIIFKEYFLPELSRALEYGWKAQQGQEDFIATDFLADQCLMRFIDLVQRDLKRELGDTRFY